MVIIGHPKSLTRYGLKALEKFVSEVKSTHPICTFSHQTKTGNDPYPQSKRNQRSTLE
ncbi:MAG: hypothetical protein IPP46_13515 [Bacteroidetes bacterium]|nr:hypothetical protein [Bacteroidota bacterium]